MIKRSKCTFKKKTYLLQFNHKTLICKTIYKTYHGCVATTCNLWRAASRFFRAHTLHALVWWWSFVGLDSEGGCWLVCVNGVNIRGCSDCVMDSFFCWFMDANRMFWMNSMAISRSGKSFEDWVYMLQNIVMSLTLAFSLNIQKITYLVA